MPERRVVAKCSLNPFLMLSLLRRFDEYVRSSAQIKGNDMRTITVAIREVGVLLLGCLFSALVYYLIDDGKPRPKMMPFANPIAALFVPIIFCLVRAGFVRSPSNDVSKLQSMLYQVFIALALIFLMMFEISVCLFIGGQGIPFEAWLIAVGLGGLYVLFYCLADATNPSRKFRPHSMLRRNDYPLPETRPTKQALDRRA